MVVPVPGQWRLKQKKAARRPSRLTRKAAAVIRVALRPRETSRHPPSPVCRPNSSIQPRIVDHGGTHSAPESAQTASVGVALGYPKQSQDQIQARISEARDFFETHNLLVIISIENALGESPLAGNPDHWWRACLIHSCCSLPRVRGNGWHACLPYPSDRTHARGWGLRPSGPRADGTVVTRLKCRVGISETVREGPCYICRVGATHRNFSGIGGLHTPCEGCKRAVQCLSA